MLLRHHLRKMDIKEGGEEMGSVVEEGVFMIEDEAGKATWCNQLEIVDLVRYR